MNRDVRPPAQPHYINPDMTVTKKRTFFWLDGKREVIVGDSVADCMQNAGYSAGALHALDFVANGDCNDYEWINQHWVKKTQAHILSKIQF